MIQKRNNPGGLTGNEKSAADHFLVHGKKGDAFAASGYSTKNMKPATLSRRAVELFQRPHVMAYIEKMQNKASEEVVFEMKDALEILANIARGIETRGDDRPVGTSEQIKAIERISKLLGWDQPDKVDLGGVSFHFDISNKGKQ